LKLSAENYAKNSPKSRWKSKILLVSPVVRRNSKENLLI